VAIGVISLLAVHHGGGLGGAPVSLLKLLKSLDLTEFAPTALFTERGALHAYAAELGLPALTVPMGGAFFYSAHARLEPRGIARFIRTFPSAVQSARRVLRDCRPDVLHLNTSVLLAWAAAARREHAPVVWVVREVLGPQPLIRSWQADFITRHARIIVAISGAVRECFADHLDVRVVHNAVDLDEFRPASADDTAGARSELGLSSTAKTLVMLGSVQRVKGHWLMLDVLEQLPDTTLVLVAGQTSVRYGRLKRALGRPLDNLDALQRDARRGGLEARLRVTGVLKPHEVARVIGASDVVVFPSLAPEGFGRPIIEAMAMARPVVATDLGPSREILGADAGLLVPPDAQSLTEALRGLLDAPEERTHLGANGRARAETCFGLERQVAEMSDVYRRALAI